MERVTRREVLGGSLAAVASVAGTSSFANEEGETAPLSGDDWIELECAIKEMVLDGNRVRLRAYNDQIPGPTITVTPGSTLRIRMKNSLPPYDSSAWDGDHNVPHGLDHTALHLHGMDVLPHLFVPLGTSDPLAPMIKIPPGEHLDYVFEIPEDHPPGLNWYHPHKHGATAVQAVSGMAGPLIVKGALDEVPEIKAARSIPLVIQDIGLFPSEDDPDLWTYEPVQNAIWQTYGGYVTINGERTSLNGGFTTGDYKLRYYLLNGEPFFRETHNDRTNEDTSPVPAQLTPQRFTLAPGEVVRFLMLNGSSDNLMPIVVDGHEVHLLAMDGVNFPQVRSIPATGYSETDGQLLLAPANRAEFLIKANATPGVYQIRQIPHDRQFLDSAAKVIAEIEVKGPAQDMALPGELPVPNREYPLIKPEEVSRVRQIVFTGSVPGIINKVVGGDYLINNAIYSEMEVPTVVDLDGVEEWHLSLKDAHHGGAEGHPFHIHVNAFEVVSIGGIKQPPGLIQDTIWVPLNETVVVRMRFKQYTGKAVYHCHILPHEDTGMMQNFLIVDPASRHDHS
ncbi:multicopper oxidase family protein [Hoeflea prorocentri]|uniref:Multicopper oxidase family protein n=1 Tax=Hoeflea prorocentri TaxID=1922333 RepID=A0A9X3UID2_9HYPH|nr:multicopper oxidase family protein [Hoeflea prorocentri]MDA5399687.1 multicopper oxidase family protein [Hoeflea prorocentri]